MDKATIIATIGAELYKEACEAARKAAPNTGSERNPAAMFNSDVPGEIEELIWGSFSQWYREPEARQQDREKLELTFQVYADMPCYSLVSGIALRYEYFSAEARATFWSRMRAFLSQEDETLSAPIEYALWCDYLESRDRREEAWTALAQDISNTRLIQRLLIASGPVPFRLKESLYKRLIGKQQWHNAIFRSLLSSRFDYFGRINVPRARSILQQLRLPEQTEHLALLRATLETDKDVPEELQYEAKAQNGIASKLVYPRK